MRCYLCNSDKHLLIHKGVRGNKDVDVYRCTECGLVFLDKKNEEIDPFYEESGMWKSNGLNEDINAVRKMTYKDNVRRIKRLRPLLENKRVLDFGCGSGGFMLMAMQAANYVAGIELQRNMRDYLNDEGIDCFRSIEDYELSVKGKEERKPDDVMRDGFDVITVFHVLEHLPDPISVLTSLKKLLNPGGRIIVEVPNADEALLALYQSGAYADYSYWDCHLFLFNNATLGTVAQKAGLNVLFASQVQRYPLSNHLYWLSKGGLGGHVKWSALNDDRLDSLYGDILVKNGIADTLFFEMGIK